MFVPSLRPQLCMFDYNLCRAMSPDSTTVEPTVPPSGSGDSSNPKVTDEVPVVEGSAIPGDTQVTSTDESGYV